jgi:hypothetical protein
MKDTIVTAIYYHSHESRIGGRAYMFEHYENPFKNLLSLGANILVFSHDTEIPKIKSFFEKNNFNDYKIIEYDLDNYLYSDTVYDLKEKKNIIDKNGLVPGASFIINDRNIHLCLSKIEFLRIAIENNYFIDSTDNYYWVDAGLFHNGIFPMSLGGRERFIKPIDDQFWPLDKNNICTPDLIQKLNNKNSNAKILFIGLTKYGIPTWWNKIAYSDRKIHIVGGFFGGDKSEILKIHSQFDDLTKKILELDELTLEEDILSVIVIENNYRYLKFDTWYHDITTDSCYYGISSNENCFYKVFMDKPINPPISRSVCIYGDSHCTIFVGG